MQFQILTQQFAARIAVDDRERNSRVKTALKRKGTVDISIRRLPLGDYQVDDTLLVERKTLADFALSVRDGRLFHQVARLARHARGRTCLILEGTSVQYPLLAIPKHAFQGALISVTLVFGLPVLRSATPEETADLILFATQQLQRRDVKPQRRYGFTVTGTRQRQMLLLEAIPDIGPKRAARLLDAFETPARVALATVEQLLEVNGIGRHIAEQVSEVFHGTTREP